MASAGAIYVSRNFAQSGGSLAVMNSSAQDEGGAMFQGLLSVAHGFGVWLVV